MTRHPRAGGDPTPKADWLVHRQELGSRLRGNDEKGIRASGGWYDRKSRWRAARIAYRSAIMDKMRFRTSLRAFQAMRGDPPDPGFIADLEYLENRDLDLSVRLGAMLAFNALMITIGTHPVSASPGAPLSLDAASQPVLTIASIVGIVPFVVSSFFVLRALLLGEEFDTEGGETGEKLRRRLFAAFIRSIDAQSMLLRAAIRWSIAGGATTLLVWAVILAMKML